MDSMIDKYYYGIEMVSGLSYTVETNIQNLNDWIETWENEEWLQIDHISEWKRQDEELIEFNSVLIRVRDICGVCYCRKGE